MALIYEVALLILVPITCFTIATLLTLLALSAFAYITSERPEPVRAEQPEPVRSEPLEPVRQQHGARRRLF